MAGFAVTLHGRIWVTPEESSSVYKATKNSSASSGVLSASSAKSLGVRLICTVQPREAIVRKPSRTGHEAGRSVAHSPLPLKGALCTTTY